jgi:hypothetical protein
VTGESGTGTTASGTIPSGALLVTGIGELVTCAGPDGSTPIDDLTTSAADRIGIVHEAAVVVVDGRVVVRPGDRADIGHELDVAIDAIWKEMA